MYLKPLVNQVHQPPYIAFLIAFIFSWIYAETVQISLRTKLVKFQRICLQSSTTSVCQNSWNDRKHLNPYLSLQHRTCCNAEICIENSACGISLERLHEQQYKLCYTSVGWVVIIYKCNPMDLATLNIRQGSIYQD